MFPHGIEPWTFRVLGGCDNHYTTETQIYNVGKLTIKYMYYSFCPTFSSLQSTPRARSFFQ